MTCKCGPITDHQASYIPAKGFYIECMECGEKSGWLDDAASRKLGLDKAPDSWDTVPHEDGGWQGVY